MLLKRSPFAIFAGMVATGIIVANSLDLPIEYLVAQFLLLAILCVVSLKKPAIRTFSLMLALVALGMMVKGLADTRLRTEITPLNDPYDAYLVVITTLPEKRNYSVRYEASIRRVRKNDQWADVNVKALLNISKLSGQLPATGDALIVRGRLNRPSTPRFSGDFDYRKYLENRGIGWTAYLTDANFRNLGHMEDALIHIRASQWADGVFRKYLTDDDAYALVKAMILGRRDDLRDEVVDAYIASGTVHILSVSGLHVGIFFVVLSYLLGFLRKQPLGKYLYVTVIGTVMIFYALVTGLSPPVLRATIMCLTWMFAEVFFRRNEPVNTLSFSAFLIFLFDPNSLFSVSFQLSFAAMLGLFLFAKRIEGILELRNDLLRHLSKVVAVSLAAQVMTLPISIFYFHQFPTYFWLSNPLVIDLSELLLPLAILLLAVSGLSITFLNEFIGWLLGVIASATNSIVGFTSKLPGNLLTNISLDGIQSTALILIFLLVYMLVSTRQVVYLRSIFLMCAAFCIYSLAHNYFVFTKNEVIRFESGRHVVYSLKTGQKLFILSGGLGDRHDPPPIQNLDNLLITRHISDTIMVYPR